MQNKKTTATRPGAASRVNTGFGVWAREVLIATIQLYPREWPVTGRGWLVGMDGHYTTSIALFRHLTKWQKGLTLNQACHFTYFVCSKVLGRAPDPCRSTTVVQTTSQRVWSLSDHRGHGSFACLRPLGIWHSNWWLAQCCGEPSKWLSRQADYLTNHKSQLEVNMKSSKYSLN